MIRTLFFIRVCDVFIETSLKGLEDLNTTPESCNRLELYSTEFDEKTHEQRLYFDIVKL